MEKTPVTPRIFVERILAKIKKDPGFTANLRQAVNPDTEEYSWGILAGFNIDLQNDHQRLPYSLVGAALCKAKPDFDGTDNLGAALAACFPARKEEEEQLGVGRLRRLLACSSQSEACAVIRPILSLINSKDVKTLSYTMLLDDLLKFSPANSKRIKLKWAQGFYNAAQIADGEQL